jgi:hypothetical protein
MALPPNNHENVNKCCLVGSKMTSIRMQDPICRDTDTVPLIDHYQMEKVGSFLPGNAVMLMNP